MLRCLTLALALAATMILTPQARAACDADPQRITLNGNGKRVALAVQDVTTRFDRTGTPVIGIRFCPDSAEVLAAVTAASVGKRLDLRIDDEVLISAAVMEAITSGEMTINGQLDLAGTNALARRLRQAAELGD